MHSLKKEQQILENSAERVLNQVMKSGAEAAEVCAAYSQGTRISLEKQDFHLASTDDGFQFGVRVIVDGKQGFASSNSTILEDLKDAGQRALTMAKLSQKNPYFVIEKSENIPSKAPSDLWDDAIHQLSIQTQRDWTKILAEEALKDSRFRINEGTVSKGASLSLILNSRGTRKFESDAHVGWSLMGMGVDGENITSFDYFSRMLRKAASVPDSITTSVRLFRESVLKNLRTGKPQNYRGLVMFSPRAVADIFLGAIEYHLNGRAIAEKTSRWKLEDRGKQKLSDKITLIDNPWLVDRTGCSAFDREGIPTRPSTLIERGVIRELLIDSYSGKALSLPSTGNASGGATGLPGVSSHCLCLAGGVHSLAELQKRAFQDRKEILLVNRFSGQVDPVTGDYSGVAKGAEWWKDGEFIYCVKETLISGNLFASLGEDLVGASMETIVNDSSEEAPYLLVNQVSVTASGE